jgi:hypothetical protein
LESHCAPHTHAHSNIDGYRDLDVHSDANGHSYSPSPDTHRNLYADLALHSYASGDTDANVYADPYTHTHINAQQDPDAHINALADPDNYVHFHSDNYTHAYHHADIHTHPPCAPSARALG